jgi:hypothetical protein
MPAGLKALVAEHSGFNAPISGGNGRSVESAIIIHQDGIHDKRTIQKAVLWSLGRLKDLSWEVVDQSLQECDGRCYESLLLDFRVIEHGKVKQGEQTIYFDITECS